MKAIHFAAPNQIAEIDVPEPAPPAPGEALLRVRRVGVCGTDIAGYLGKAPFFDYPRIPGHELGVEVLEVGDGVENVRPGDLCAVEPYLNCQSCYSCDRGHTNCCEHNQTLGVMCDGGLAERIVLPARKLHPAPGLRPEQCALVETLGIGCHAVDRGRPAVGETVLVIGAGPIGLGSALFAQLAGARTILMDLQPAKLEFARGQLGIEHTLLAGEDADEQLEALTGGRRADVVIDATGSHHSMAAALDRCAFRGRVVFVGISTTPIAIPQPPAFHRRELDILASRNALTADFTRIIDLVARGRIDTDPWITHRIPFADLVPEFPRLADPATGVVKAMVEVA